MSELRQLVHRPAAFLRQYVREILWISSDTPRVQTLMPETTLTLAFRQTGSVSLHDQSLPCSIVSGLQQKTRIVEHSARSSLLVVRFTEVGAPAILHQPADELYNHTSALDSLLPQSDIDHLQNVLHNAHQPSEQVAH